MSVIFSMKSQHVWFSGFCGRYRPFDHQMQCLWQLTQTSIFAEWCWARKEVWGRMVNLNQEASLMKWVN